MKVITRPEVHDHILDKFDNQNIKSNKIYEVIGIDHNYYRIVNEVGDPILYPKYIFEVIDSTIPESWVRKDFGPDEYYIDPLELSETGFYEDYFDNVADAKKTFDEYLVFAGIKKL